MDNSSHNNNNNNANNIPQEGSGNRKFVKDRTNDLDSIRKNREEKATQLRKEKRQDRTNIERRKFKIDSKETESTISNSQLRRLDILPKKAALLYENDPKLQLDGAIYFRRVLAADKNPPLDAILEIGTIIPALASFLMRYENGKLQLEAAWSITNIACGEPRHIQALLKCDVINLFANLIHQATLSSIKEQSLWALSNISSEETACLTICSTPNLIPLILFQLGIQCQLQQQQSIQSQSISENYIPGHLPENDNPSLSVMRHVTFICGNILKQKPPIAPSLYKCILFAFADLLQSPDEEIKLDISQTIATVSVQQPEVIPLIAEQGIISRLRELAQDNSTNLKEMAIVALCSIFKTAPMLFKKSILVQLRIGQSNLSHNNNGNVAAMNHFNNSNNSNGGANSNNLFLQLVHHLLSTTTNNSSRRDGFQALIAFVDLGKNYKSSFADTSFWSFLFECLSASSYDVKVDVANFVSRLFPDLLSFLNYSTAEKLLAICRELISFVDGEPLVRVLQTVTKLLQFIHSRQLAPAEAVEMIVTALHEKIDFLAMHPMRLVAEEANRIDLLLRVLEGGEGSYDN